VLTGFKSALFFDSLITKLSEVLLYNIALVFNGTHSLITMNFPANALSFVTLWLGHGLYAIAILAALWRAPWIYLRNSQDANVLFGSYVALYALWRMGVGLQNDPGLEFHLLLVTTLTLMFGWAFAILGTALAQLALTIGGQADWGSYTLNTLANGVVPVIFTYYARSYALTNFVIVESIGYNQKTYDFY
jgi:uncharacterized membrane protein